MPSVTFQACLSLGVVEGYHKPLRYLYMSARVVSRASKRRNSKTSEMPWQR